MHSAPTPAPTRRPWLVLLSLAASVTLVHFALWHGAQDAFAASSPPERSQTAVQVRTVEVAVPPVAPPQVLKPVAKPAPAPPPRRVPSRTTAVTPKPEPVPTPVPGTDRPVLVAAALPASASAAVAPAAAVASAPDDVPVYRTEIPPAMTLNYDMHRGAWSGTGEFQWRPSAAGYEARLEGRLAGFSILTWASLGGFDAAGLAPVRYTDKRRGKGEQAANFQREAGKISFSGPSTEYPLLQGTQDRLSWMIQIAAIAAADPKALAVGARVAMFVAGARGDADVWTFRVQGSEEVVTATSTLRAIKLVREPRKPHDTRVEVWLAPSLHHLPVRARLINDGSALELLLRTAEPGT